MTPAGAPEKQPAWDLRQRQIYMENLALIAKQVGHRILGFGQAVQDTEVEIHGHSSSTIDDFARREMITQFQQVFNASLLPRDWSVTLNFEDAIAAVGADGLVVQANVRNTPVALIDEIDGTTNVKRAVASRKTGVRPRSAVCIALKSHETSTRIECGAVYAFDEDVTFTGLRAEESYIGFRDGFRINVGENDRAHGDSKQRIIVANYSNHHHHACATLIEAIEASVFGGKCEVYGGSRSSTIDVVDIMRNQYDAYVDCRQLWTSDLESNSVLRVYDVAGVLPVAAGAGLSVTLPDGSPFGLRGEVGEAQSPISIVIGRPTVVEEIVTVIRRYAEQYLQQGSSRGASPNP